jgi:enoyl-CoA hydratase/carnithine racemase
MDRAPGSGPAYELALANAVLGAAEAHILGIESLAAVGKDTAERTETVADRLAEGTLPEGAALMVPQFRARRLSHALRRAVGGTMEDPHDPVLAAACDAVLLARLLIGYRQAAEQMEPDLPTDLLGAVPATLRSLTARMRGLIA